MDRIDLHLNVPAVKVEKLIRQSRIQADEKVDLTRSESSRQIRKRVEKAREIQNKRFKGIGIQVNAKMRNKEVKKFCEICPEAQLILKQAVVNFHLSARAYFRVIKVSRTIADLTGSDEIKPEYVAEALQYRTRFEN